MPEVRPLAVYLVRATAAAAAPISFSSSSSSSSSSNSVVCPLLRPNLLYTRWASIDQLPRAPRYFSSLRLLLCLLSGCSTSLSLSALPCPCTVLCLPCLLPLPTCPLCPPRGQNRAHTQQTTQRIHTHGGSRGPLPQRPARRCYAGDLTAAAGTLNRDCAAVRAVARPYSMVSSSILCWRSATSPSTPSVPTVSCA